MLMLSMDIHGIVWRTGKMNENSIDIIVNRLADITRELEDLTEASQELLQEAVALQFQLELEEEQV